MFVSKLREAPDGAVLEKTEGGWKTVEKYYRYIDDPDKAPEGADVEEAPNTEGRWRYETDSVGGGGGGGGGEEEESEPEPEDTGVEAKDPGDLSEDDIGERVSFFDGNEVVEGELTDVRESYDGSMKVKVQLEDQPDSWPAQPFTLEPGDEEQEVQFGEDAEAELVTDELGLVQDYTYHAGMDGRGNNAELTEDNNIRLNQSWNNLQEISSMAGDAAEWAERKDEDERAQRINDAMESIESQKPSVPDDSMEPQGVELDPEQVSTLLGAVGDAQEYRRDHAYPEDDIEELEYTRTALRSMLGEAQTQLDDSEKKSAPSFLVGSLDAIPDGATVEKVRDGVYKYYRYITDESQAPDGVDLEEVSGDKYEYRYDTDSVGDGGEESSDDEESESEEEETEQEEIPQPGGSFPGYKYITKPSKLEPGTRVVLDQGDDADDSFTPADGPAVVTSANRMMGRGRWKVNLVDSDGRSTGIQVDTEELGGPKFRDPEMVEDVEADDFPSEDNRHVPDMDVANARSNIENISEEKVYPEEDYEYEGTINGKDFEGEMQGGGRFAHFEAVGDEELTDDEVEALKQEATDRFW